MTRTVFVRGLGFAALCSALFVAPQETAAEPRGDVYIQHNLVSDLPGHAERRDPNLVNPWGISFSPTSPFWVSDNHTGVATLYNGDGDAFPLASPLVVTIPPPSGGSPPAAPTGQVFNGTSGFTLAPMKPAVFLFATEDGTISGWNPTVNPTVAILKVDNSSSGAVYKGLASGHNSSGDFLYATNFSAGKVDVFDTNFAPATLSGGFVDTLIPRTSRHSTFRISAGNCMSPTPSPMKPERMTCPAPATDSSTFSTQMETSCRGSSLTAR